MRQRDGVGRATTGRHGPRLPVLLLAALALMGTCDASAEPPRRPSRLLWRVPLPVDEAYAWRGVPAVDGGRSDWKSATGVVAVDLRSGARIWTSRLPVASLNAPNILVQGTHVAVADWWGVAVLERATGAAPWSRVDTTQHHDTYLDATGDALSYFEARDLDAPAPYDAWLVAADLATGAERWRQALFQRRRSRSYPTVCTWWRTSST